MSVRLKNWNAKRSGATMTICGVDEATGQIVTITGISRIEASSDNEGAAIVAWAYSKDISTDRIGLVFDGAG